MQGLFVHPMRCSNADGDVGAPSFGSNNMCVSPCKSCSYIPCVVIQSGGNRRTPNTLHSIRKVRDSPLADGDVDAPSHLDHFRTNRKMVRTILRLLPHFPFFLDI